MPTDTGYQSLNVSYAENVMTVEMDSEPTRNALSSGSLGRELIDAMDTAATSGCGCVILTGRGAAFSAGGDLREMASSSGPLSGTSEQIVEFYRTGVQRLIHTVYALPMPTVAAINGSAIGAGLDLALACDIRLASTEALMSEPFVRLGLISGDGGGWLLPRAVGSQRAAELAFTGRTIDAHEALRIGMVLDVVPPGDLAAAALRLASRIAANPTTAVLATKAAMRAVCGGDFASALETIAPIQARLHRSSEHRDALLRALEAMAARKRSTEPETSARRP